MRVLGEEQRAQPAFLDRARERDGSDAVVGQESHDAVVHASHSAMLRGAVRAAVSYVRPMSQRTEPPFRADHVGSLLRPAGADGRPRAARRR